MSILTPQEWMWLALSLVAGLALGLFYFGGLWYTVRMMTRVQHPLRLFLLSFAVRTVIVLGVIYWLGAGMWQRMVVALAGMIIVRFVLTRRLGLPTVTNTVPDTVQGTVQGARRAEGGETWS